MTFNLDHHTFAAPDDEWIVDAECAREDPTWWDLPAGAGKKLSPENKMALRICGRCAVARECRDYANLTGASGIWGAEWRRYRDRTDRDAA